MNSNKEKYLIDIFNNLNINVKLIDNYNYKNEDIIELLENLYKGFQDIFEREVKCFFKNNEIMNKENYEKLREMLITILDFMEGIIYMYFIGKLNIFDKLFTYENRAFNNVYDNNIIKYNKKEK